MSPRKSSTSSGRPRRNRPRYLGVEVAGEHLPPLSLRAWQELLAARLGGDAAAISFRVVRTEGRRAVIAIDRSSVASCRAAWNRATGTSGGIELSTHRTWGTLVGAKRWVRGAGSPNLRSDRSRSDAGGAAPPSSD